MNVLVRKVIFYFFLILSLSYFLRFALHEGLRRNSQGIFAKYNTIFHSINDYDLIFIGSSRAECHFNPKIIDSICNTHSYNIGIEGSNMAFTYGILKSYLFKSKPPKKMILNIDFHFSHESSDTIYNFSSFFPYLDHPILYDELKKRDSRFLYFKFIPLVSLPFLGDKYINKSLRGYLGKTDEYDKASYKGYLKVLPYEYKNLDLEPISKYRGSVLKQNKDYLDSIVDLSKKISCELYFVVTPTYYKGTERIVNYDEHINQFKRVAIKNSLYFFDYTGDAFCRDKNNFADFYHLKGPAAELFSIKFAQDFKKCLNGDTLK